MRVWLGAGSCPTSSPEGTWRRSRVMGTGLGHGSLQAVNPQLRKAGSRDTLRTWPLSSEPASITSGCVTHFLRLIKWGYNCLTSQTCCENCMAHVQGLGTRQASWGVVPVPHPLWLPGTWSQAPGHLPKPRHVSGSENDRSG